VPLQTYCTALSRRDLAFWKFKMYRRFYSAKKRNGEEGLLASIRRAVSGLFHSNDHATKLETVARNAMTSLVETILATFSTRYMTKAEESAMFASWDAIYRRVREQKIASGAAKRAPSDTSELHRANVIPALAKEHGTVRTIAAPAQA
jgi:hypothetical protein